MAEVPLNKEVRLHRLFNQRRIAFALVERARTLLAPSTNFSRELHELFQSQGKYGSKDRRLYRELIYTYLRYLPWLAELARDQEKLMDTLISLASPTEEIQSLYPTIPGGRPPPFPENLRHRMLGREDHELGELFPEWFPRHSGRRPQIPSLLTLITRPPLWLRVQRDPNNTVLNELRRAAGPQIAPLIQRHESVPDCIRAPSDFSVAELPCYLNGQIEIQDISSQVLLHYLPERPEGTWLDACAGAGGKTLQLAKMLQPYGKVEAYDTRPAATRELLGRVQKAGYRNVRVLEQRPTHAAYDGVLVDAPCSGSGTWRRHPYLMRQIREQDVLAHADNQIRLLKSYALLVRPGGFLIYCTCSISVYENEEVGESFLDSHPEFVRVPLPSRYGKEDAGKGITIYPEDLDGDALHIAAFRHK